MIGENIRRKSKMGYYLNSTTGLQNYTRTKTAHYFVDKTSKFAEKIKNNAVV